MVCPSRTAIAVLGVCLSVSTAKVAQAINAVYIPGSQTFGTQTNSKIEVQGFNGRIDLPVSIQGISETAGNYTDSVSGGTSDGNILYTLLTPESGGTPSIITENDAHTGAYLGTIQLPGQFSDIAYTNRQLYGVQSLGGTGTTQSFAIDGISSAGATQPIATQSASAFIAPAWRLSGLVAGDSLLVVPNYNYGSTNGYVFVPTTSSAPTTVTLHNGPIYDTVIHADGTAFTPTALAQSDYSYPSGTLIGARASNASFGSTSGSTDVSDEFAYNYSSSQPAVASLATSITTTPAAVDGLYRLPQVVNETETVTLQNGVAPDGTTISNVVATNLIGQISGPAPLPLTIHETDSPAGSFSNRQLAQATISINLANTVRGMYSIGTNSNLTGDYTTGGVTQTGRSISAPITAQSFAYDPVSSNLVGNGDASLEGFGWASIQNGQTFSEGVGLSTLGFGLDAETNFPESMRQILQLPTPGGPMLLSFEYELGAFDAGDLTVTLNGVDLGDLTVSSTTPGLYQTVISNPALEGVSNADLSFNLSDPAGSADGATYVEIGSISLTAVPVPEPTSIAAIGFCSLLLGRYRQKRA